MNIPNNGVIPPGETEHGFRALVRRILAALTKNTSDEIESIKDPETFECFPTTTAGIDQVSIPSASRYGARLLWYEWQANYNAQTSHEILAIPIPISMLDDEDAGFQAILEVAVGGGGAPLEIDVTKTATGFECVVYNPNDLSDYTIEKGVFRFGV